MERGYIFDGHELPKGTEVYVCCDYFHNFVYKSVIDNVGNDNFYYVYHQELYATPQVRAVWNHNIHLHPHCTLFEMLRVKLKI